MLYEVITGLPFIPSPSPYKGLSSLDTTVEFSGHLKACAIVLNKIANDLRWMNSGPLAGLAEISLPEGRREVAADEHYQARRAPLGSSSVIPPIFGP